MLNKEPKTLIIGNFDGVHIGHQALVDYARGIAGETGAKLSVLTFRPHPREVILDKKINLILPYEEKINLLKKLSVDEIDEIKFNKVVSKMSPEAFVEEFLIARHNPTNIIVGKNFRFGFKASGDIKTLEELGSSHYKVHAIDIEEMSEEKVSSTLIKKLLIKGEVSKVNKFLGRNYFLSGEVVQGEKRGRELGFPTTNLSTIWRFLPRSGVYVTYINYNNRKLKGITNIGYRPTFGKKDLLIESHIFDFNEFIYGEQINIEFIERIRSEKKFDSVDNLIENIKKDVKFAQKFFEDGK